MKPNISIVIPAFNSAAFLPITLESVLSQSRSDWELVLVNDGSVDHTQDVCEQYASGDARIQWIQQANSGPSAARNQGMSRLSAQSQFVVFLDADDIWEEDALERLTDQLESSPQAVAAHGTVVTIDAEGQLLPSDHPMEWIRKRRRLADDQVIEVASHDPTTFDMLSFNNCIPTTGTVLIRRSALTESGLFDPSFDCCEDWDIWLRLSRLGPMIFTQRGVLRYRIHPGNTSRNMLNMYLKSAYVRCKTLLALENTEAQRSHVLAGLYYALKEFQNDSKLFTPPT